MLPAFWRTFASNVAALVNALSASMRADEIYVIVNVNPALLSVLKESLQLLGKSGIAMSNKELYHQ